MEWNGRVKEEWKIWMNEMDSGGMDGYSNGNGMEGMEWNEGNETESRMVESTWNEHGTMEEGIMEWMENTGRNNGMKEWNE